MYAADREAFFNGENCVHLIGATQLGAFFACMLPPGLSEKCTQLLLLQLLMLS